MSFGPRTFPCPRCNEMINDSMKECRYCWRAVDPRVAQVLAGIQEQANRACGDASYLRTAAIAMYVFLALSMVPFVPLVTGGFVIVFVVVVILLIRWKLKFGALNTADQDFQAARHSWMISFVMMIVAAPLGFMVRPLVATILYHNFLGE